MTGMQRPSRPDSTKLAEDLFSQIDTTGKGYIEKSDLENAFKQVSSTSTSSSADELFTTLDKDSDGKVTQDEMTSGLQSLMDSLDSQFQSMRMSNAMGSASGAGNMPPPPPVSDTGLTKEELQSQLDEIGATDSKRSSLISSVIANFDKADTDGNGKVSFQEAMAYDQSSSGSTSTTASTSTSTSNSTASSNTGSTTSDAQFMLQIMRLAQAYGLFGGTGEASSVATVA
jgi:Ca2+-binding EF-hand superfamily protein